MKTKKVKIGAQVYALSRKEKVYQDGSEVMGLCHKNISVIEYGSQYPEEVLADTVLHEVLHAVWHNYLDEPQAEEEKAVTMLAHGLIQVIRDNPKFIDELRGML